MTIETVALFLVLWLGMLGFVALVDDTVWRGRR